MHRIWLVMFLVGCQVGLASAQDDQYKTGPDAQRKEGVPVGVVTKHVWDKSEQYPGTVRDYWVYVPKQYKKDQPACLMVFQDGQGFVNENGHTRVPIVFDNLIQAGEMPVTIAVFIQPGVVPAAQKGDRPRKNRSFEYDTLDDRYVTFLLTEILADVEKDYSISQDPSHRAICGNSSGGICAFTAAWERPDAFGKVVSHIGSFVNIRGGHNYPAWIRKTERKPIKVFLQDGSNDLDNLHGNWPLANQQMAAALAFMKYDYKFVYGQGKHSARHGGQIFPDTMRWIWSDVVAK